MKIIKTKLFKLLVCIFCIGILLGIISFILTNSSNKLIIKENMITFIENIESDNINYFSSIFKNISSNLKIMFIIWIFGLLCFTSLFIPFIILYKSIKISFELVSLIYSYKIKGLFLSLFYLFPFSILYIFLYILISYYSIYQAIKCFRILKANKTINLKAFIKNYILIFIILSSLVVVLSILEIYFLSFITKFVV